MNWLKNYFTYICIFRLFLVRGGSFNPSDSNYIGLGPFSEVETRSISRYIANMTATLSAHLSFRAFGQRLLIPFAHTTSHMYNYNETVRLITALLNIEFLY